MTNLVSSICVSPSRERARIAKMESERLSTLSQLIAEISAMDSVMGVAFSSSREAMLKVLAQSDPSFVIHSSTESACVIKFPKPNSVVFDPPLVSTHPSDKR